MFRSWSKARVTAVAQENANASEVPFVVYQVRLTDGGWSEFRVERQTTYDETLKSPDTRVIAVCQPEVKP